MVNVQQNVYSLSRCYKALARSLNAPADGIVCNTCVSVLPVFQVLWPFKSLVLLQEV